MSFEGLLDQDHAKKFLMGYLRTGRIPNAFLFCGPKGVGKKTAARLLAKALNCQKEGEGIDSCGQCPSCVAMDRDRHPDWRCFAPERGSLTLGIDQIRTLKSAVSLKSSWGGYKVVVVLEAERMTQEAANALLKTLEEPPHKTVIILTASARDGLERTIVSRCQHVGFELVKHETIRSVLIHQCHVPEDKAELWAYLSCGSLGRALEEAGGQGFQLRAVSLDCLMKVLIGEESPVFLAESVASLASQIQDELKQESGEEVKRIKEIHKEVETGTIQEWIEARYQAKYRQWLERLMDSFVTWFRDAVIYSYSGGESLLMNRDHGEELSRICDRVNREDLIQLCETAILMRERLGANVQLRFLLERIFLDMSRSVHHA